MANEIKLNFQKIFHKIRQTVSLFLHTKRVSFSYIIIASFELMVSISFSGNCERQATDSGCRPRSSLGYTCFRTWPTLCPLMKPEMYTS